MSGESKHAENLILTYLADLDVLFTSWTKSSRRTGAFSRSKESERERGREREREGERERERGREREGERQRERERERDK